MTTSRQVIEAELPRGQYLGRYRIEEPVGQGGMGTVYKAYDETTNRNVALKLLAPGISEALRERFLAECVAQAKIRHPHVMPVYDQGWYSDTRPYFTMELLYDPVTLTELVDWVADGSLSKRYARIRHWADPVRLISDVILPISDGIAVANDTYRIQHRDLKPDNILVDTRTRRPYVIDFGICRDLDGVTPEKKIVGTPRFLSTEQARGVVDARTDIWGLAALVHYTLSGTPPLLGSSQFTRPQVNDRILQLQRAERKALDADSPGEARGLAARREQLEAPDFRTLEDLYGDARSGNYLPLPEELSSSLRAIIQKGMSPEPAGRYATATDYVLDLRTFVEGGAVAALSEAGATGAAVDAARRALKRNLAATVGIVAGLVLGAIMGRQLFKRPPLHPDFRLVDVLVTADEVERDARTLHQRQAAGELDPATAHRAWAELRARLDAADGRVVRTTEQGAPEATTALAFLRARLAPARLKIQGSGSWSVVRLDAKKPTARPYEAGRTTLPPGLYQVRRAGAPVVHITLRVPFTLRDTGQEPLRYDVVTPDFPADAAVGMAWVQAVGSNGAPGLLVARRLVTCEQYGEYLDDIPAAERNARLPTRGFHQGDPNDASRWLARADFQTKPVTGLTPANIALYLNWRGEVDGANYRLLTDAEWERAAGGDQLGDSGADRLFPDLRRVRNPTRPAASPSGIFIRRRHNQWGEVVRMAETLVVKGDDDSLPLLALPSALARSAPYVPGADADYGFRLVLELD